MLRDPSGAGGRFKVGHKQDTDPSSYAIFMGFSLLSFFLYAPGSHHGPHTCVVDALLFSHIPDSPSMFGAVVPTLF